jgi:hypothetical protein
MINADDDEKCMSARDVYQVDEGNNLMIRDEKEPD